MDSKKSLTVVLSLIVIAVLGWVVYQYFWTNDEEANYIEASGIVEGTPVVVSAKLAGQIEKMSVNEGDLVSKGQEIATLASKQLEARVKQAEAQIGVAETQVRAAEAAIVALAPVADQAQLAVALSKEEVASNLSQAVNGLEMARLTFEQANIKYENTKRDYEKYIQLYDSGGITKQQLEQSKLAYDIAKTNLQAAQVGIKQAEAVSRLANSAEISTSVQQKNMEATQEQIQQAKVALDGALAQKRLAEAGLEEVRAILEDTVIKAPVAGTVTLKLVNEGELLNQGTPVVEIIDLTALSLTVYVSGQDIGIVKLGQEAKITVDSVKDKYFQGKVIYIADKAEFTPKNVHMKDERVKLVYGVKLQLEDTGGVLKPGMPADAILNLE